MPLGPPRPARSLWPVAAFLVLALTVLAGARPVEAQAIGSSELTYSVDLDAKTVTVSEAMFPAGSGGRVSAIIPPDATGIAFDGRIVGRVDLDRYTRLDLIANTGDTLSYTMPSTTGRAAEGTRVTSAMIGFHLLPSLGTAGVRVNLPQGFVANMGPAFVPRLVGEETLEYVLGPTDANQLWGLWFVALKESGLVRQLVSLENVDIEVAAWADDPEWMDFAVEHVEAGIPLLEEQIGQQWPRGDMWLVESVAPDQAGYGGWFDWRENRIEITDTLDSAVFFHELAHVWFNDLVFEDRWVMEGLAEEYASSVAEVYGAPVVAAEPPGERPEAFDGLNDWQGAVWFEGGWEAEIYGYNTSYWVVSRIRDEIGDDGMAATIAAMFERRHPYALEGEDRQVGTNDWRRLLDMLELRGSSTQAEDLFRDYVVTEPQARLLDTRRHVMDRYAELEEIDPEPVPESIRVAMSDWRFSDALRGIEQAEAVLDNMQQLEARALKLGLAFPVHLDSLYLRSGVDFTLAETAIDEVDAVLSALERQPNLIDDETASDFRLGRLDEIERIVGNDPDRLNRTPTSQFSFVPYLGVLGGLFVVLSGVMIVWLRMAARPPEPDPGDSPPPSPATTAAGPPPPGVVVPTDERGRGPWEQPL